MLGKVQSIEELCSGVSDMTHLVKKSFMPKSDNLNLIPGMYVKIEGKTDVTKLSSDLHICTVAHMHPSPIINTHTRN